jgi:putative transposase
MLRFRQTKSLQKFASVHANLHIHFSQQSHLVDRQDDCDLVHRHPFA